MGTFQQQGGTLARLARLAWRALFLSNVPDCSRNYRYLGCAPVLRSNAGRTRGWGERFFFCGRSVDQSVPQHALPAATTPCLARPTEQDKPTPPPQGASPHQLLRFGMMCRFFCVRNGRTYLHKFSSAIVFHHRFTPIRATQRTPRRDGIAPEQARAAWVA